MSRDRQRTGNVFAAQPAEAVSLREADSAIFGSIAEVDKAKQVAKPINIFEIHPDRSQPRRSVPSAVRLVWDGTPAGVASMLHYWIELAEQERGRKFSLETYFEQGYDDDEALQVGPVEKTFLDLVALAASIYRDGLTNPITVVRSGTSTYRLETGERRWLAFHLLWAYGRQYDVESKWEKIPARQVDEVSVWRQAAENGARANLNAIARARQFAILMMDLWKHDADDPVEFSSFDSLVEPGGSDRRYYAQISDLRPPRGKGEQLVLALGAGSRAALTRCRTLLALPDEAWQIADDLNTPEDTLLKIARMPEGEAIEFMRTLIGNVSTRNVSGKWQSTDPVQQFRKGLEQVRKRAEHLHKASPDQKEQIRELLDATEQWLTEFRRTLEQETTM